jgi:hypothetical protein
MNAKTIIGRRLAELEYTANRFSKGPTSSIDCRAGSAEVVVFPHDWTPSRNVEPRTSWVTLDAHWGKRLGAQRNGKVYRLPRREFVRKMAELRLDLIAEPQPQAITDACETGFELGRVEAGTSIWNRAS